MTKRTAVPLTVLVVLVVAVWWLHDPKPSAEPIAALQPEAAPAPAAPPRPNEVAAVQLTTAGYGPAPVGSECAPEDESYDFAAAGRLLVAKICEPSPLGELVRNTYWGQVTPAESEAILSAAGRATWSHDTPCTGARPYRTAWLMKDVGAGELTHFSFIDHVWSCTEQNESFSKDLDPILVALRAARRSLSPEVRKPAVTDAGAAVRPDAGVTIAVGGAGETPIGSTCMRGSSTYTLAPDAKLLSWETCEPSPRFHAPLRLHWHERPLTPAERDRLLDKLRRIETSSKTTCEAGRTTIALTSATEKKADLFLDDAHACRQSADRRAVTGLDPLLAVLRALAKEPTADRWQDEND